MSGRARIVNPGELGAPRGFSHGVLVPAGSRLLFVAGQVGSDATGSVIPGDFVAQFERALGNVLAVVEAAGGTATDVVRLTFYVTDCGEYLAHLEAVGVAYRRRMGRHFPAMTLVEVSRLVEPGACVELEATAALPPD